MNRPAALLAALAAAACSQQGGNLQGGNGQADSGGQSPAAVSIRPGQWETTTRMVAVDAPDAPPEAQSQLQASLAAPPTVERSCLTPAEAADMAASLGAMAARDQPGYSCQTGEGFFAGGRARLTMMCRSSTGGPDMRLAITGSYTGETSQLAVSAEITNPATAQSPALTARVDSTVIGRRVGECTGNETD